MRPLDLNPRHRRSHPRRPHRASTVQVALTFGLLIACAGPAAADVPLVLLRYDPAGLSQCPTEEDLRGAVAARLGLDPFKAPAELEIAVQLSRDQEGLVAEVVVKEGGASGLRRLSSRSGDCRELAAALVLTLSLVIDPLASMSRTPEPPAPRRAETSTTASEGATAAPLWAVSDRAERAPAPGPSWMIQAALLAGFGLTPSPGPGAALGVGVGGARWSVALEGRFLPPTEVQLARGTGISVALINGALLPCVRPHAKVELCGLLAAGAHRAQPLNLANPHPVTTPFVAAGGRVGAEPWSVGPVSLLIFGELAVSVVRTTLEAGGQQAWLSPDVWGTLGAGLRLWIL